MTTTIYNNDGKAIAQSHNLRAMLRGAALYGGVRTLLIGKIHDGTILRDGMAEVKAMYANGYLGVTVFASYDHAVEWAFSRSHLSGRSSYFAGCAVHAPDAQLDEFTRHYLIAALWSSTTSGDEREPLDGYFDIDDIGPEARAKAISDCRNFQHENRALLKRAYAFYVANGNAAHPDAGSPEACAGHDFWLTRNRHGAGFWDRGMARELGDALTDAAHMSGEVNIDQFDMVDPTAGGALDNSETV